MAKMDIFEAENTFYLRVEPSRLDKFLCHPKLYERLFQEIVDGDVFYLSLGG